MIVYRVKHKKTGRSYIGQTGQELGMRIAAHIGNKRSNYPIGNALRLYGKYAFNIDILVYCEPDEVDRYEELLIKSLGTKAPDGYNLAIGGRSNRGWRHSPETIERIRETSTGRLHTEAAKLKISQTRKEKQIRHDPETLEKIKVKLKGKTSHMKGKKHTEETKAKISSKCKGYKHDEKTRSKIGKASDKMWANRSRTISESHRQKLKEAWVRRKASN